MAQKTAIKSFVFRFADVTVREREFAIAKAGKAQQVEPKAFQVLLILIRNPNQLIAKEELLRSVWGETVVTENSLARNIALLRRLLDDDPRAPRFIETVSSIGYWFICPVEGYGRAGRGWSSQRPRGAEIFPASKRPPSGRYWSRPGLFLPHDIRKRRRRGRLMPITTHLTYRERKMGRWARGWCFICAFPGSFGYTLHVKRHSLTDKDSIVLADFVNTTGDSFI